MVNEIRFLPFSGRNITLDNTGQVFLNGAAIKTCYIDGECCVKISWMFGMKYYSIALLMVVTFEPMHLPDFLWESILPLFKDGDNKNLMLSNITYRFKGIGIQVPDKVGFYYIPFFTMYAINKNGILINACSGKKMTWYVVKPNKERNSTGGYKACRAVISTGVNKILFRHRALALAFKEYGANIHTLVVNHRDGNPANDELVNLEWATHSQNNLHAYKQGLRPNSAFPILVKDLETGAITEYVNVQEASRCLGIASYKISYRLNNCYGRLFNDGLLFIKANDERGFPCLEALIKEIDKRPRDVLCIDTLNSVNYLFGNRTSCASFLGVSDATLAKYLNNGMLISERYSVKIV